MSLFDYIKGQFKSQTYCGFQAAQFPEIETIEFPHPKNISDD